MYGSTMCPWALFPCDWLKVDGFMMLLSKYFQYFFVGLDSRQKAMASELRNVISFSHVISLTFIKCQIIPVFINIYHI